MSNKQFNKYINKDINTKQLSNTTTIDLQLQRIINIKNYLSKIINKKTYKLYTISIL